MGAKCLPTYSWQSYIATSNSTKMSSESNDNPNWGCCGVNPDSEDYTQCLACNKKFHLSCLISSSGKAMEDFSSWECPLCVARRPRISINDNTPMRFNPNTNDTVRASKRQALQSPPEPGVSAGELRSIMNEYYMKISTKFDSFTKSVSSELKSVKEEMTDMKNSMDYMNSKFESLLMEHKQTKEAMAELQAENSALKANSQDLNARVNVIEQNARAMNVEIQCVPEKKNENLLQIVTQLGSVFECNIKKKDITQCSRIAKINPASARPKSIVVQFSSKKIRDEFLAASINFNRKKSKQDKLNTSHLGLPGGKTSIFVVDHLSPVNKALHAAARSIGKEKGFKYVWVRNGRVFMRRTDDSDYVLVRDMDTLNRIKQFCDCTFQVIIGSFNFKIHRAFYILSECSWLAN